MYQSLLDCDGCCAPLINVKRPVKKKPAAKLAATGKAVRPATKTVAVRRSILKVPMRKATDFDICVSDLPKKTAKVAKTKANMATTKVMKPKAKVANTKAAGRTKHFALAKIIACRKLYVGSDCSGLASECMALMKLGVHDYVHLFACDISRHSKRFIDQNVKPKVWFDDATSDDHRNAPYVDVYVAGFPCQSFSVAGMNRGLSDGRGQVLTHVLDYIERRRPIVFVLENVKNLLSKTHADVVKLIKDHVNSVICKTDGVPLYDLHMEVLNSKDYGVPQSRDRVYIVGRRLDHVIPGCDMNMAQYVRRPPNIREFLKLPSITKVAHESAIASASGKVMTKNLKAAVRQLTEAGIVPHVTDMVVDVASGQGLSMMHNICPTITRSRGQTCGFYLMSAGRRLSHAELCKLQGFDPAIFSWEGISDSGIGALAGNAMTVPVIAAVLREALLSTGLARYGKGAMASFP